MIEAVRPRVAFGLLALLLAIGGVDAAVQQPSQPNGTKAPEVFALSGCISAAPDARKVFTLADTSRGQTYKLTGRDMHRYIGQHVEVLGTPSKGLRIVGGLYPSPNAAAQAGALDPAQAAIAAQSGPAGLGRPLVEFKVKSVRVSAGGCPER
jgi:hypothetical protein